MWEIGFIVLRVLTRCAGQIVGYYVRTGKWRQLPAHLLALVIGAPALVFGGICVFYLERVPYSNRMHFVFLSKDDESYLAQVAYEGVMRREGHKLLPEKEELYATTRRVANDLLHTCKEHGVLPEDAEFRVSVIRSTVPNAFVLPDGSIFVYTGILPICKTEAGLACVLGHEISHALARHSAEKIGFVKIAMLLCEFIRGLGDHQRDWASILIEFVAATVLQVGLPLAHSRKMETEADKIGLTLSANAGYDPRAAPELWKRMEAMEHRALAGASEPKEEEASKSKSPSRMSRLKELFSTHPSHARRAEELTQLAESLMPEYTRRIDYLKQCTTLPVPDSDRLLLVPEPKKAKVEEEDWGNFDIGDASALQSAQLAQKSAALMVGDQATQMESFLREIGRWDKLWGER